MTTVTAQTKGVQARVTRFGQDEQGKVYFYVENDPLPFRLQLSSVDASLIPFLAEGLGVTMNADVHNDHYRVTWWSFVKTPIKDPSGSLVPWEARKIRYPKFSLPLASKHSLSQDLQRGIKRQLALYLSAVNHQFCYLQWV